MHKYNNIRLVFTLYGQQSIIFSVKTNSVGMLYNVFLDLHILYYFDFWLRYYVVGAQR